MSAAWLLSPAELVSARDELIDSGLCCAPEANPDDWSPAVRRVTRQDAAKQCAGCPVLGTCLLVGISGEEFDESTIHGGQPGWALSQLHTGIERAEEALPALHAEQRARVNDLYVDLYGDGLPVYSHGVLDVLLDERFQEPADCDPRERIDRADSDRSAA